MRRKEHDMHELTDLTDDGIKHWVADQQRYLRGAPGGNFLVIRDSLISFEAEFNLSRSTPSQIRRAELLEEYVAQWQQDNQGAPMREHARGLLNQRAANQALTEARAGMVAIARNITALRNEG